MNKTKTFDEFTNIVDSNITGDYHINYIESNSSALDKEHNEINYTAIFGGLDFFLEYFNGDNYEKPRVYFHVSWNHFTKYDYDELVKFEIFIKEMKQIIKELEN
jgi:hypothetical protein